VSRGHESWACEIACWSWNFASSGAKAAAGRSDSAFPAFCRGGAHRAVLSSVSVAHYDGVNRSRLGERRHIGSATVERCFQDYLQREFADCRGAHARAFSASTSLIYQFLQALDQLSTAGLAPLVQLGQTLRPSQTEIAIMWRFTRNNGITKGFHTKMQVLQRQSMGSAISRTTDYGLGLCVREVLGDGGCPH
jgi:hypothetical protein